MRLVLVAFAFLTSTAAYSSDIYCSGKNFDFTETQNGKTATGTRKLSITATLLTSTRIDRIILIEATTPEHSSTIGETITRISIDSKKDSPYGESQFPIQVKNRKYTLIFPRDTYRLAVGTIFGAYSDLDHVRSSLSCRVQR